MMGGHPRGRAELPQGHPGPGKRQPSPPSPPADPLVASGQGNLREKSPTRRPSTSNDCSSFLFVRPSTTFSGESLRTRESLPRSQCGFEATLTVNTQHLPRSLGAEWPRGRVPRPKCRPEVRDAGPSPESLESAPKCPSQMTEKCLTPKPTANSQNKCDIPPTP